MVGTHWSLQNIAALVAILGGCAGLAFGVHEYFAKSAELERTRTALLEELQRSNQKLTDDLERARCKLDEEVDFVARRADMALDTLTVRKRRREINLQMNEPNPDQALIDEKQDEINRLVKKIGEQVNFFNEMNGRTNCA